MSASLNTTTIFKTVQTMRGIHGYPNSSNNRPSWRIFQSRSQSLRLEPQRSMIWINQLAVTICEELVNDQNYRGLKLLWRNDCWSLSEQGSQSLPAVKDSLIHRDVFLLAKIPREHPKLAHKGLECNSRPSNGHDFRHASVFEPVGKSLTRY